MRDLFKSVRDLQTTGGGGVALRLETGARGVALRQNAGGKFRLSLSLEWRQETKEGLRSGTERAEHERAERADS